MCSLHGCTLAEHEQTLHAAQVSGLKTLARDQRQPQEQAHTQSCPDVPQWFKPCCLKALRNLYVKGLSG